MIATEIGISLLLGIPTIKQFSNFLHCCIDNLVGKTGSSFNNINSDLDWTKENYNEARKIVENIYKNKVSRIDYNIETECADLGADKIQSFNECYEIRKAEIQHAVANECLAKLKSPVVTDFDWKLKWIIGSSMLASVREPVLQVDLHTLKINEDDCRHKKTIQIELNHVELDEFINQIEKSVSELRN